MCSISFFILSFYCSAPIHQSVCNKNLSYYCHHILTITYVLSFLFSYTTSQSQKNYLSAELVFHIPTIFLDMIIIISIKNYFFIFIIKLIKSFCVITTALKGLSCFLLVVLFFIVFMTKTNTVLLLLFPFFYH